MENKVEKISTKIEKNLIWFILLIASYFRFTGLVHRDFWYDEAFTGVAIKEGILDMVMMIVNDVHPPLYYILLKGFASFFNYSVFGIRLFSAIFGVLIVWSVYVFTKELANKRAALFASFIAAISPFAIQYSQEARMYSMLVFFIMMAAYFFARGLRTDKRIYFIWWGIFTGLSMLTHYMGIIFSLTYCFVFVIWLYCEDSIFLQKKIKDRVILIVKKLLNKNILIGYFAAFVIFLPWLSNFIRHLTMKGDNLSWVRPASLGDFITAIQMFLFGTPLGEWSSGMPQPNEISFIWHGTNFGISHISIRMVLAFMFGLAISMLYRKEKKEKISTLLFFSVGFMTMIYALSLFFVDQQYFVARYLLPGAFFIFVFIGIALSNLKNSLVLFLFAIYFTMISAIVPLKNSTGYNEIIKKMDKYRTNDIYILNSFDYVITKFYLGEERLTLYNYDWPQYNPYYWAAIGNELKRTENFDDLKNPNAIIISNKPLNRDNQYFSTKGLELIDRYNNILVYRFAN